MRKSFYAAAVYTLLGLAAGMFYREFTKAKDFTGQSQLSVLHTHLLALGMLFFLIVLAVDKALDISGSALFTWFFWIYNLGMVVTVGMMVVHGVMTVDGKPDSDAVAGIAGVGHILLTIALVLFFLALRKPVFAAAKPRPTEDTTTTSGTTADVTA